MSDLIILFILLMLSGLFSGSETALTSLSVARVQGLVKENRPGALALQRLKNKPTQMLVTLLIGNNLVNIGASAMATVIAVDWFGELGLGIAVGLLTLFILVFGEVTPKSLAIIYAERISLTVAPLMLALRWLAYPLVWLLEQFTLWIRHSTGIHGDPTVTESELLSLAEYGADEGAIEPEEHDFIERVFEFGDLEIKDVMTHRQQIFALNGERTVRAALPDVLNATFSRIPLYRDHAEEIRWIVHLRDILTAVHSDRLDEPLKAIGQEPIFALETQPIAELFAMLCREKRHLAIVVDEYGALQGLVTMEDLLEELVGEIYDESDITPQETIVLSENAITVGGAVEMRVVETFFDLELPGKSTDTVSYWILASTGRIPSAGENFTLDGLDIRVDKASHRHIQQITVSRTETPAPLSEPNER